jgi:hypothetical protein
MAAEIIPDVVADIPPDLPPDLPEEITPDIPPETVIPPDGIPFSEGPYGLVPFDTAGPFVVPTLNGEWDFEQEWGYGKKCYVFISHAPGYDYVDQLLNSSYADLLKYSPANVHYFFMSYDKNAEAHVLGIKEKVQAVLDTMESWESQPWEERLHFVTEPAHLLDNWLGQVGMEYGYFTFAIDRHQRFRETGLLAPVTGGATIPQLKYLTHEVIYFNYEYERDQTLAAEQDQITEVTLFELEQFGGNKHVEVDLPDAATMASFDTLEVDLTSHCSGNLDYSCGDWDYKAALYLCDEDDPDICDTEIARWITSYKRQGRWVTDISQDLALLKDGGTRRFRYDPSGNSYLTTMTFRFSNRDKGMRPIQMQFLWGGGGYNLNYNPGHEPIEIDVPEDAKKVELLAFITGHGFGSDVANCAEFCNHTHHFEINGSEEVKEHLYAGTGNGCQKQIKEGVVPNQYGTWPLGRGGWCPGFDVKPFIADFTDAVQPGPNTITYKSLYKGQDYDPIPARNPSGFGGSIWMSSYIVYWK